MRTRILYFSVTAALFITEVAIAAGTIGGPFVRGSVGDVLAVALVYYALRVIPLTPVASVSLAVTVAFSIEALQFFQVAEQLGYSRGSIAHTLMGNTFSAADLGMYVVGGLLAFHLDRSVFVPRFGGGAATPVRHGLPD